MQVYRHILGKGSVWAAQSYNANFIFVSFGLCFAPEATSLGFKSATDPVGTVHVPFEDA